MTEDDRQKSARARRLHYVHRLDYSTQERLAGLFILGALLLLVLGLAFNQHSSYYFADTFELTAYMRNAQGISTNTRVKVAGVEVGRVTGIDVSADNRIAVTMRIREQFHELIRSDAVASLNKLSMLGNATLEISGGSNAMPPIRQGGSITVKETASMDEVIAQVTPALQNLARVIEQFGEAAGGDGTGSIRQLLADSGETVANLKQVSEQLAAGNGIAGKLLNDEAMAQRLDDAMAGLERTLVALEARANELEPVIASGNEASRELPRLTADVRALVSQLSLTLHEVNRQLSEVPDIVVRTRMLMEQANRTMNAVQNTWPISGSLPEEEKIDAVEPQPPID